ncbi:hypothetical protein RB595_001684 [Gaeumannomyces hyphopodioides]
MSCRVLFSASDFQSYCRPFCSHLFPHHFFLLLGFPDRSTCKQNNMDDRPDILVAIDFGTTCTGVGWARPQQAEALQTPIQVIHNWPGASAKNEQKVHTCLVYNPQKEVSSWGFLCDDDAEEDPDDGGKVSPDGDKPADAAAGNDAVAGPAAKKKDRREFFKIFLDKATLLEAQKQGITAAPESPEDARLLASDYLRQIYTHVKETVESQAGLSGTGGWAGLAVEFIFSVPTTWRSQEIINTFKDVIKDAGFGTGGPKHTAAVDLTESEAAAVATVKNTAVDFVKGDIFMSVDAGGGTTDFAVMQVVEASRPFPALAQLAEVDGVGIGSTLIDRGFLALVASRLRPFPELQNQLPPGCAHRLVRSERFRIMKHKFGERVYASEVYKLPLEGVGYNFSHAGAGIESGRMLFSREEIQSLFDPHIQSMLNKIRDQLDWVHSNYQSAHMNYMVLSGGLGSSAYVRDTLEKELAKRPHPCARQMQILQAPDPQLVVVKGLLLDRMQKLDSGYKPVLVQRRARANYGLVCKIKYNPEIHIDEDIKEDPLDGQKYATGQIDWVIKKGDMIDPSHPLASSFSQKIDAESSVRAWDAIIMICNSDRDKLPKSIKDERAKQLCTVKSDLSGIPIGELEMKKQSRGRFRRSKRFYVCNFDVRVIVAPAEIRFELWFNGHKFSGDHDPIEITWDEVGTQLGNQ